MTSDILVTGAGGFIGRHLVGRMLALGRRVRVLVRRPPDVSWLADSRVEIVQGDLSDPALVARAVDGTRLVYHLGATMQGSPADFERGTIAGTRNVVASVSASPATRLVYVSSLSVLHAAAARPGSIVREDWPLEPQPELRGLYTGTKLRAEAVVRDAVHTQQMSAVIVRPGQVVGRGTQLMTPAVARRAGRWLVIIGDGRLVLPLVYVEDLIDALLAVADHDVFDGSVFHIVDESAVTQNELTDRYRAAVPEHLRVVHIPVVAMRAVGLVAQLAAGVLGRTPPLSPYRIASALAPLRFDCQAARGRVQWTPQVGVQRGLDIVLGSHSSEAAGAARGTRS
ncbi:MAG: NAD-dependent epimerase/dehydratase family protein [Vicinamibacterales bacterium]